MTSERLIERILAANLELSREKVLERLERERKRTEGLISDETLLRVIAAEFGVEIPQKEFAEPVLSIGDLIPSLNDVSIVGRIVAVLPSKSFEGKRSGRFASLFVVDISGMLRVLLWNDKTSLVEDDKVQVGQIARFSHCYTREGRSGNVELHMGERSEIDVNPQDVDGEDYPSLDSFAAKIVEIQQHYKKKRVNLRGRMKDLFPSTTFERQDSTVGKVMRLVLVDGTGSIPVVVWNEKVDELEKMLKKGIVLEIVNGKVKKTAGSFEIHVDTETYVGVTTGSQELTRVGVLKEGLNGVSVEGVVVAGPMVRDVKTSSGEVVRVVVFELGDETGRIWVSAWRKHADAVRYLKVGDRVAIRNCYVKRGFGDQLEISTRGTTTIKVFSKNRK